jgi:hypothetical protein
MKTIKLLIYAILVTFTISTFTTPVYAASVYLSGSSSVKAGSTVSIGIVLGQTSGGATGAIEYDASKLTYLSSTAGGDWPSASYSDATKRFSAYREPAAAGTILTLNFQVKRGASGTTIISVKDLNISISLVDTPAPSSSKTITITQPTTPVVRSSDAKLKSLSVAEGALTPAFSATTTAYSLSVSPETEQITINAVPNFAKAKVSIGAYTLIQGETTPVNVVVTAENGSQKTYTIQVTRELPGDYKASTDAQLTMITPSYGALSPAFDTNIYHYAIDVPYECTEMSFTAQTSFIRATSNVLGISALTPGVDNVFYVVAIAEDKKTTKIYTITVRRSAVYSMYLEEAYVTDIINQITKQTKPVIMDMSSAPIQVVASSIMTALKENPDRQLIVKGPSARVTIKGSDLKEKIKEGFYDFTINPSSQYKDAMMSQASDADSFVFSTHHQGAWPGNVEYAIDTAFLSGTEVNVYRYDAAKDQFATIAKGVVVNGGTVAFAYDEGGDFLITTATLDGAVSSGNNAKQPSASQGNTIFYLIGMGLTLFPLGILAGIVGSKYFRKRRKRNVAAYNSKSNPIE